MSEVPTQMKAQVVEDYSEKTPIFVFRTDIPVPSVTKDKQVLVQIKASGINPADSILRSGSARLIFKLKFPCILGLDGSGVVVKVGSGVTRFKVGDHVLGGLPNSSTGTNAEYCLFEEDDLIKKPSEMTHSQAAALPTVGGTVVEMFRKHPLVAEVIDREVKNTMKEGGTLSKPLEASEKKDLTLLIIGASGGTGSISVLLAKLFLARYFNVKTYAVCSEKNVDYVKSLGADHVIDYTKTSASKGTDNYHRYLGSNLPSICQVIKEKFGDDHVDFVLDCVGGYYFYDDVTYNLNCAKSKPYTAYGCLIPPGPPEITIYSSLRMGVYILTNLIKSSLSYSYPKYQLVSYFGKKTDDLNFLVNHVLLENKGFEKLNLTHFPFGSIKDAHNLVATKRTVGKIVIDI